MQDTRKFPDRLVRGILAIVSVTKPNRNQILFLDGHKLVKVVGMLRNKTIAVVPVEEQSLKSIPVRNNQLTKCVMHVMEPDKCTATIAYDVNITVLNKQRILDNIGKVQYGFLNCIDLLKPEQRFNEDGTEKLESMSKGYRFFVRLVSEEKAKKSGMDDGAFILLQQVPRLFREPYPYEHVDAFVKLTDNELQISSGVLKGTYQKI